MTNLKIEKERDHVIIFVKLQNLFNFLYFEKFYPF
jgi:hypothetical protein